MIVDNTLARYAAFLPFGSLLASSLAGDEALVPSDIGGMVLVQVVVAHRTRRVPTVRWGRS